jgi:hypothetical protein
MTIIGIVILSAAKDLLSLDPALLSEAPGDFPAPTLVYAGKQPHILTRPP